MNHIVLSTVISLIIAQIIKFLIDIIKERKPNYRLIYSNGSMPSSHSSILSTMLVMVGYLEGIDSTIWGITLVFSLLVIGDAMGIRSQTGRQAVILNRLASEDKEVKPLRELVGHKPSEVIGGIILGIVVAIIYIALITK